MAELEQSKTLPISQSLEWVWDKNETTAATLLSNEYREVCFHPSYSSGTAAVRGNTVCTPGRDYFWEIEILTPLYGTDVMVGVGTAKVNLKKFQFQFSSMLGSDAESWGFSYNGTLHHNGILKQYGTGFTQGSTVGVHLDMWRGTLTFYVNREPLGVAFTSLNGHMLYPMVCSTAARSAVRVACSHSQPSSLQLSCLKSLSTKLDLMEKLQAIPGLRIIARKAFWLLFPSEPLEQVRRQTTKRGRTSGQSCGVREDLCEVCNRPEQLPGKSTDGIRRNTSKRLCILCDVF